MTSKTDTIISTDRQMGFALLRVLLGFNMLGRTLVRIPEINNFASGMAEGFAETILPGPFVYVYAFVIVIAEFMIGILLVLGWKTRWALAAMGVLLLTLTFGQVLQQNFGTLANILIYGIGVSFLLFNTKYDHFGIDRGFSVK